MIILVRIKRKYVRQKKLYPTNPSVIDVCLCTGLYGTVLETYISTCFIKASSDGAICLCAGLEIISVGLFKSLIAQLEVL